MKYLLNPIVFVVAGIVFFGIALVDILVRHGESFGDMSTMGRICVWIFAACLVWCFFIPIISSLKRKR